tara:strand:- start:25 stop:342 length:318 start_codon:yes stop_codon:yes gene_type:complete
LEDELHNVKLQRRTAEAEIIKFRAQANGVDLSEIDVQNLLPAMEDENNEKENEKENDENDDDLNSPHARGAARPRPKHQLIEKMHKQVEKDSKILIEEEVSERSE